MQIPILSGVFSDQTPDVRTSYPVNLVPVPVGSGVSSDYLRPADGLVANGTGPGLDRGGINWNGVCYRVMGSNLVTVGSAGVVTVLGDVGNDGNQVTLDYSFTLLGIASNGNLFFYDPSAGTLVQNVDPDLGVVLDVVWVDGYWMTTDGEFLVVTELTNPLEVNPLKYGSSEVDPDPVVALLKVRNEVYALNRNTIEVFDNVGGDFFPFQRIDGAQVEKGAIGTHACCIFTEQVAFLGSGVNEAPGVYLGANATTQKISTQEIDEILLGFTEAQLALCKMEARNDRTHQHLYLHLLDRTLVYDAAASQAAQQQVWFTLTTSLSGFSRYRAQNWVWCFDKWLVADPLSSVVGYATDAVASHWGQEVRWEFGTLMLYNGSKGAVVHELELVALTGVIQPTLVGDAVFTAPGTYAWIAPSVVNRVTAVCVGGGGGGGGGGSAERGGNSSFASLVTANGGSGSTTAGGVGGTGTTLSFSIFGGNGGSGANIPNSSNRGGGGGAGGYSGNGGFGGSVTTPYSSGLGGGGAGGSSESGGGVGIYGESASGITSSQGGSGGTNGVTSAFSSLGGFFGGGAAGRPYINKSNTARGGGGGGGLRGGEFSIVPGVTYNVTVGAGGGTSYKGGDGAVRISWNIQLPPPQISTSYSLDGKSWSQDHFISAGGPGETRKRLVWRRQGFMRNFRVQRFRGTSAAKISFLRLEAQVEALAY